MFQVIKMFVVYMFNILETKILQFRCHCQYIYIQSNLPSRPPVHGGHPEVPPMHFTIYFTSIWQPHAQRGQRPLFCAKKAKMNLLSRPQLFFSARYKEMSAIVKKKVVGRLARVKYR